MSAPLFLVAAVPEAGAVTLDGSEGRHAADVARLRPGEQVLISDGRGAIADAVVTAAGRGRLELSIARRRYVPRPSPRLVVAQGLAKGDRAELAVQVMTEAGVDEIVPWRACRCVVQWRGDRADRALDRWAGVAREAAKQARRPWLPVVAAPESTAGLAPRVSFVLHEEASVPLSRAPLPDGPELVIAVGPEGGIAPEELAQFTAAGAVPVRLGDTVLRTSTAGLAALAVLSARLGRW